jgi:hypothetical protein
MTGGAPRAGLLHRLRRAYFGAKGKGPFLPTSSAERQPVHAIGMATVVRNEARYLPEWIEFHTMLGVERFFIYDNGSTDDLHGALAPYVERGCVNIIPWLSFDVYANTQTQAYGHAIANLGPSCRWVGFFDVDEFVFPTEAEGLVPFLDAREHLPAIGVVGLFFGTSGHQEPPAGRVIDVYHHGVPLEVQKRFPRMLNIKSFVQPHRVELARSAHYFNLDQGSAIAYSEYGDALHHMPRGRPERLTTDLIRYNHYFTRSRSEFEAKRVRRSVRGVRFKPIEQTRTAMFELIERHAVEDHTIAPWAEKLRRRLDRADAAE